ncbi:MAG TPA: helicase, partial [Xanthobacteraceae bacterium]
DTLSTRIAHIRTWTFAANRPDWLADPEHWQGVTRGVEDRLSDALHERLTERFVDRRTSVLMRRLRENATLEPAFNKTGEVEVEGHIIGRLDGFVFLPDASSGGSEAKALQNAAQKALAVEIGLRATRLAEAPDDQFVLASDGTLRWIGAAVGKLSAGDEVLRPRLRLIADEHLTGAPREAVEARLDRFVKAHIEKLLGPLTQLSAAADITGIARGIAFQLVESLGVLERLRVAEEMKGLEQPARASLRKYGVRFGAYHIYLPGLLKPAPRRLAAQLWALRHDATLGGAPDQAEPQSKGVNDLLHLAGSGRTSIPVDREIDPALYRTAGYRVCGERAVRVDILERLADLIRPALTWREGAPGVKPAGVFPGGGFTVVNTMTSLTGASGEDFASILRSLGYRMERRPKPPEPRPEPSPAQAADTAPPDAVALPDDSASATDATAEAAAEVGAPIEAAGVLEAEIGPPEAMPTAIGEESQEETLQPIAEPVTAEASTGTETSAPVLEAEAGVAPAQTPPELPAAEPVLVEVWRPGRTEGRRRPRPARRESGQGRGQERGRQPFRKRTAETPGQRGDETGASVAAAGDPMAAPTAEPIRAEAIEGPKGEVSEERHSRQRHRRQGGGKPFGGEHRPDRPHRERERQPNRPARFERREKAPDPNSPFAKLAALKAQLEADAKERH